MGMIQICELLLVDAQRVQQTTPQDSCAASSSAAGKQAHPVKRPWADVHDDSSMGDLWNRTST